jgi:hypothetical protein
VFVWTPLSGGPRPVRFGGLLADGRLAVGKPHVGWVDFGRGDTPALQAGDAASFVLVALAGDDLPSAWEDDRERWRGAERGYWGGSSSGGGVDAAAGVDHRRGSARMGDSTANHGRSMRGAGPDSDLEY